MPVMQHFCSARLIAALLACAAGLVAFAKTPVLAFSPHPAQVYREIRAVTDNAGPRLDRAALKTERGSDHVVQARQLNDLGLLYQKQGRYAVAESHYQLSFVVLQ